GSLARAMAASAVCIETCFPLVIVSRRARYVIAPAGLLFLVGIRALMGPTFEQFMLCYVFWVPWGLLYSVRARSTAIGATSSPTTTPSIATSACCTTRSGNDRHVEAIAPAASATRQATVVN